MYLNRYKYMTKIYLKNVYLSHYKYMIKICYKEYMRVTSDVLSQCRSF